MNVKGKKDGKKTTDKKKDESELDFKIRFYDDFTLIMDGLKKSLIEADAKRDEADASVNYGIGNVEQKEMTQGLDMGATRSGIYGVIDLLFNPNAQEYLGILSDGKICRYDWAGNTMTSPKPPSKSFTRFIYCAPTSHYILWTPNKSGFFLTREDFSILIDSVSVAPIDFIIYGGRKTEETFDFFIISGCTLNRYNYHPSNNILTLQDAMTISDIEADKKTIELTCFDDPKDERKQWIYCTFGNSCTIIDVAGKAVGTKRNLHSYRITGICAVGGSDHVVTGDEKGNLKLWNGRWSLLTEIKAHAGRVTNIIEHPDGNGQGAVSFGYDQKLFVLSFKTQAMIESLNLPEVVQRVCMNKKRKGFMTQGARKLVMWRMNMIFEHCLTLDSPLKKIVQANDMDPPTRIAALCENNLIHLMNSATGNIITTAALQDDGCESFAYQREIEGEKGDSIYALNDSDYGNNLQIHDCGSNPGTLRSTWESSMWPVGLTCVAFFKNNPKIRLAMKSFIFNKKRNKNKTSSDNLESFLLCGRRDGCVCVINLDTGAIEENHSCHKSSVLHIEIDHEMNQAISVGSNPSIRLWNVGINEDELLIPLMDITWKHPIRLGCIVRNVIAFPMDCNETGQHYLGIYNTSLTEKFEHDPNYVHKSEILSLNSCRDLHIFVTSSTDGTIGIWSSKNQCFRIITLNLFPNYASFVSRQGDIFFSCGTEIYAISGNKYLTVMPRTRAIAIGIPAPDVENPIPLSAKIGLDPRLKMKSPGEERKLMEPFQQIGEYEEEKDTQQAHDIAKLRLRDEDLWKIVEGDHPIEQIGPDFRHMSKKDLDEFGKSVYDDGEDHKFFVAESRLATMMKMKGAAKDLDNFDNIN